MAVMTSIGHRARRHCAGQARSSREVDRAWSRESAIVAIPGVKLRTKGEVHRRWFRTPAEGQAQGGEQAGKEGGFARMTHKDARLGRSVVLRRHRRGIGAVEEASARHEGVEETGQKPGVRKDGPISQVAETVGHCARRHNATSTRRRRGQPARSISLILAEVSPTSPPAVVLLGQTSR